MRPKATFLIFAFSAIVALQTCIMAQETKAIEFDPAFVHVVYFWLNEPESESDRMEFEEALYTLLDDSKYTKTNFVGTPPKAIRDVVDDSFTYCLIVTFDSEEAQESYQVETAHLKFIEDAGHLWNKVVVYDALEHKQ